MEWWGVLWSTAEYLVVLCSMRRMQSTGSTVEYAGVQWSTVDSHGVPRSIVDFAEYAECTGVRQVHQSASEYTECLEYRGVLQSTQSIVENHRLLELCRVSGVQWSGVECRGVHWSTMSYHGVCKVHGVRWSNWSFADYTEYVECRGVCRVC